VDAAASLVFGASAADVVSIEAVGAQAWRGRGCAQTARVGRGNPVVGREGRGNDVDAGRDGRVGRAQRRGGCGTGWERQWGETGRGSGDSGDGTGGACGGGAPEAAGVGWDGRHTARGHSSFAVASSSFVAASAAAVSPVSPSMSASFARTSFSRCCCLFFPISLVRNLSAHEGMHPSTTALATHLQVHTLRSH
jgi:hypothetical protein